LHLNNLQESDIKEVGMQDARDVPRRRLDQTKAARQRGVAVDPSCAEGAGGGVAAAYRLVNPEKCLSAGTDTPLMRS
jgi:hypothetical protein